MKHNREASSVSLFSADALRESIGRVVLVNTIAGVERAFSGDLQRVDSTYLVLTNVELINPKRVPLQGAAVVPLSNIAWVQVW